MLKSGIVATFRRRGIFSLHTIKIGNKANVKSHRMFSAEYTKVRLMITSLDMQLPVLGCVLSQKKEMGRHCNMVTKKKTRPVMILKIIAQ